MTEIVVLNEKFESSGKLASEVALTPEVISTSAVHQVVKATLANRRQGNASTKNRAATNGGGAKPFKQKGTGRARQGSSRSPLMVGGGVAFGPTPRDFSQKLNKKMVLRAIQSVVADKLQAGKLTVIEELKSSGKTKEMFSLLDSRGLLPALVVTKDGQSPALRAVRNLRNAKGLEV
ncbi:MAG: 50S ribosomal protein L4, partial [Bdellovibrionales bacterium]|nr:50S ribosomal protein L4 [Bdellovibrionales bacterium]